MKPTTTDLPVIISEDQKKKQAEEARLEAQRRYYEEKQKKKEEEEKKQKEEDKKREEERKAKEMMEELEKNPGKSMSYFVDPPFENKFSEKKKENIEAKHISFDEYVEKNKGPPRPVSSNKISEYKRLIHEY